MKRPLFVALVLTAALGTGLGYFIWSSKKNVSPTGMSVGLMPGSVSGESEPSTVPPEREDLDFGSDAEAIEQLTAEIEKAATGDEDTLENESGAETENFIDGAAVMEQLGTSYAETDY